MSTLGYGMYGYNKLNVNGETDSLPICRLYGIAAGSIPQVIQFLYLGSDEYSMAVPNQGSATGTWSAIRIIEPGIYEISADAVFTGGAGTGTGRLSIYLDRGISFGSSGVPTANDSGTAYFITDDRAATPTSILASVSPKTTLFLDKDTYIYCYADGENGTNPSVSPVSKTSFIVRCISLENSGKPDFQI